MLGWTRIVEIMNNLKQRAMSNDANYGLEKILAALFYGISSLAVIFINKIVLTTYQFPYFIFLAAIQFLATTVVILTLVLLKKIDIPLISMSIFIEVAPISMMFLGNVVCGLGSTKSLNLPMFTALRRFSILLTMLGEYFILSKTPSSPVVLSVVLMVGGALIAAFYDIAFDLYGYVLVFSNNLFTALSGIYMKKASLSTKCSKMGVLFYNSLFSAIALFTFFGFEHAQLQYQMFYTNKNGVIDGSETTSTISDVISFEGWSEPNFVGLFLLAAILGSVLNYSIFLCTTLNSALTTAVVGCLKNVLTTYVGMLFLGDYIFHWLNFIGLNVSILGSLYYTYVTMFKGLQGFGGG